MLFIIIVKVNKSFSVVLRVRGLQVLNDYEGFRVFLNSRIKVSNSVLHSCAFASISVVIVIIDTEALVSCGLGFNLSTSTVAMIMLILFLLFMILALLAFIIHSLVMIIIVLLISQVLKILARQVISLCEMMSLKQVILEWINHVKMMITVAAD